ncbi:transglutaminase-like cysteine peptidase [Pseudomonas sp. H9]|uniref:transglutaminase-like cysteine peptidase n=1 Tax=Pseudomonas sp. H9 TaxID=483968 RepID=UPI0014050AF6|nr:transglutaminase-like cysteine peptidase [Pseudomonas sp. H9]
MIKRYALISKCSGERVIRFLSAIVLGCGIVWGSAVAAPQTQNTAPIQTSLQRQDALQRISDWRALISESSHLSDHEKLRRVNDFFNRTIRYGEDIDIWKKADYWASPMETLEMGMGDCEDFALAKFFTLQQLGIADSHLRMVYATQTSTQQAHMVLGYWADADAQPVVLDNLENAILPIAQRNDLAVRFAFDELGLYSFDHERLQRVSGVGQLPNWQPLLQRAKREEAEVAANQANGTPPNLMMSALRTTEPKR